MAIQRTLNLKTQVTKLKERKSYIFNYINYIR